MTTVQPDPTTRFRALGMVLRLLNWMGRHGHHPIPPATAAASRLNEVVKKVIADAPTHSDVSIEIALRIWATQPGDLHLATIPALVAQYRTAGEAEQAWLYASLDRTASPEKGA